MKNLYWGKTIGSILIILLLMPLGHALMIIMEHTLEPTTLHYSAFAMGFVGLIVTICGVFVKGDTKQTCYGMTGALLFWTGWVEFLFAYYAQRYGVHCDLVGNGIVQTATEYVNGVGFSILIRSMVRPSRNSDVWNSRKFAVPDLNTSSCLPPSVCG